LFSRDELEEVSNELSRLPHDFFDIYVEDTNNMALSLESGKIERPSTGVVFGAGIRILLNGVTYFGVVDNPCVDSLLSMCGELKKRIKDVRSVDKGQCVVKQKQAPFEKGPWARWNQLDQVIDYLKSLDEYARTYDAQVVQVSCQLKQTVSQVQMINSLGNYCEEERNRTQTLCSVYAADGDSIQTGYGVEGKFGGLELLDSVSPEYLAVNAAKMAVSKLKAVVPTSGEYPVILGPGPVGVIFHEAVGHSLEADSIRKQVSVMRGRLGEHLGSPIVTLVDSGVVPGGYGSSAFDDEGFPNQETVLIQEGVLVSYMSDYLEHLLIGFPHTSSGRRESYAHIPYPRMRNTYLMPGKDEYEGMLSSIEKGVLVSMVGGGQVDEVTGDFIFDVIEAYLIENGRITTPLKEVSMVGNGLTILHNVAGVSQEKDLRIVAGLCGKENQLVPIGVGEPYLMISKIFLGGE